MGPFGWLCGAHPQMHGSIRISIRVRRGEFSPLSGALVLVALGVSLMCIQPTDARATDRISVLPGFNGTVRAISQPDAKGTRYIGGDFTAFNAWDTGGSAVYLGGGFNKVAGRTRNYAAAVTTSGTLASWPN
jgi:hypothetical protein